MPPATPSREALVAEVAARAGASGARQGTETDAVDGVVPGVVVEPAEPEGVARTLAWARETGRRVLVRGGGTKLDWGPTLTDIDVVLSTRGLCAVEAHRHGDLTATVQAGATLAATNALLAEHRQWLALDPPWAERATIGGIVATNDSGPRRQWHGAPRDLIIGMTIARPDGVVARSGGIVVKNVAGYDLARLFTGSFGCLGVILNATFKLAPLPAASRTVSAEFSAVGGVAAYADALLAHASIPTAFELSAPPAQVLARFESVETVAVHQAEEAVGLARSVAGTAVVLTGADETAAWRAHESKVFGGEGTLVKLALRPADLALTLAWLDEEARSRGLEYDVAGCAGLGVLQLRLHGAPARQAAFVTALRDRLPAGKGSAVLRRADPDVKQLIDVWGPIGDSFRVMQEVKRRFDPTKTVNPGRGPGGL